MKGGNTQTCDGFDVDDGNARKKEKKNATHTGDDIVFCVYRFSFICILFYRRWIIILYAFRETYCTCFTDHCLVK